jgi:uncharacterized protein YcfJ
MKTPTKPLVTGLIAVLGLAMAPAWAGHDHRFPDRARVVSSTPVYEQVNEPRRECWTEEVRYEERVYRKDNDAGPAVLGAIVGGLVGSTIGKGDGKVAAAAVGAATGAVIGDRWNDHDAYYTATRSRPVEHCRMVDNFRQVVVGYDVVYRYQGKEFITRLPHEPGKWLDVNVSVQLADNQTRGDRGFDPRDARRDYDWRY